MTMRVNMIIQESGQYDIAKYLVKSPVFDRVDKIGK